MRGMDNETASSLISGTWNWVRSLIQSSATGRDLWLIAVLIPFLLLLDAVLLKRIMPFRGRSGAFIWIAIFAALALRACSSYQSYATASEEIEPLKVPVHAESTTNLTRHPFPSTPENPAKGSKTENVDAMARSRRQAVIIAVDTSGSMNDNDPDQIAWLAASLGTDLMSVDMKLGGLLFNKTIAKTLPLGDIAEGTQSEFKAAFKQNLSLPYGGSTNSFSPAIRSTVQMFLKAGDEYGRYLILLSDLDREDTGVKIDKDLLDVMTGNKVQVFPVVLGRNAATDRIAAISYEPPLEVLDASELPAAFTTILGKIWDTREVSTKRSRKTNDYVFAPFLDAAREVDILVYDRSIASIDLRLVKPDGTVFSDAEFAEGGNYTALGESYRIMKVMHPDRYGSGSWSLRVGQAPDKVAFLQVVDLGILADLDFDFTEKRISARNARVIRLSDGAPYNGDKFYDPEQGAGFEIVVQRAGHNEEKFPLLETKPAPDGTRTFVFEGHADFNEPGDYQFFLQFRNSNVELKSNRYHFAFDQSATVTMLESDDAELVLRQGQNVKLLLAADSSSTFQTDHLSLDLMDQNFPGIELSGKRAALRGEDLNPLTFKARRPMAGNKGDKGGRYQIYFKVPGSEEPLSLPLHIATRPDPWFLPYTLLHWLIQAVLLLSGLRIFANLTRHFNPKLRLMAADGPASRGRPIPNQWTSFTGISLVKKKRDGTVYRLEPRGRGLTFRSRPKKAKSWNKSGLPTSGAGVFQQDGALFGAFIKKKDWRKIRDQLRTIRQTSRTGGSFPF